MQPIVESLVRRFWRWNRGGILRRRPRSRIPYERWCERHDSLPPALSAELTAFAATLHPELSVDLLLLGGPSGQVREAWLSALKAQIFERWRLHVVRMPGATREEVEWWLEQSRIDARIWCHGVDDPERTGWRALLHGLEGPWCSVVSEFEYFRPHTLLMLLEAASANPNAVVVYGDEDRIDESGRRHSPWFKGDFDPESLLGHDAIGRPALFRTEKVRECAQGLDATSPALLHDLALQVTDGVGARDVVHVPHVLCHRRNEPHAEPQASARVVQSCLERRGIAAQAECMPDPRWPSVRVRFELPEPRPSVTIVVPTRNNLDMSRRCVASVLERTTYRDYEVLIVDNGSDDPACLRWLASVSERPTVRVRRDERPFNFSTLNNDAVREARGQFVALLNDDVEVITPGWLEEMVSLAARPGVGAVGARLLYADHSLQHGGVVVGLQGAAGHVLKRLARAEPGPGGRARLLQSYLAVTGACLVVRRALYESVGGMDEAAFAVAFNDVDLCLKLHAAGYRNLWTPHAELFHHESVSRGREEPLVRKRRLQLESRALRERWSHWMERDPHYNPNLSLTADDFSLADPPRVRLRSPRDP